ncbi:Transcription elongation factor, GreA/GreB, C-term [bacterium A37T11]|nr:Transcription elongation factor, GreA/GreB, C-term [bacterium A37T11]
MDASDKKNNSNQPVTIQLHATVKIRDFYGRDIHTFHLVQPEKATEGPQYLSIDMPLAKKILGKKEGDIFDFRVISGATKKFMIIEVT